MKCPKCGGRVLLERLYSENKDLETSCLICGKREFVNKGSEIGKWLVKKENELRLSQGL